MSFNKALKSTLDKVIFDLATANGLDYVDMDGTALNSERLLKANNAIAWSKTGGSFEPRTFFDISFDVGGVTKNDPAQRISASIVDLVLSRFSPGSILDIYDYSGTIAPTQILATMTIVDAQEQPLITDAVEGLRLVSVNASGAKFR